MTKAILFDLDGTLLPMDQDVFTQAYFDELASALCPAGLDKEKLIAAVWGATKGMIKNDGSKTNRNIFWEQFEKLTGLDSEPFQAVSEKFYTGDFHRLKSATQDNPLAREAVRLAGQKGRKVVLATNPLFPRDAQLSRISWLGLRADDFDLITSFETDSYCKPNPAYYSSILERIGAEAAGCLMIGNDEDEDMFPSSSVGINSYLVTDCLIPSSNKSWTGPRGDFASVIPLLGSL